MTSVLALRCRTCGTEQPAGSTPHTLCQHCGHTVGAGETILDQVLALIPRIQSTNDKLAAMAADAERRASFIPMDHTVVQTGIVPTPTANLVLGLGKPEQGRVWQVRRATIGGVFASTAVAGTYYLFRQGTPPVDLNMANLVDFETQCPNVSFYGTHQFIVQANERVWGVLNGGTAGQQIMAILQVEDWPVEAFAASRSVFEG